MQKIKNKVRNLFIQFIVISVSLIVSIIVILSVPVLADIRMGVLLILLIIFVVFLVIISPKMQFSVFQLKHAKLSENPSKPVSIRRDVSSPNWINYLLKKEFLVTVDSGDFALLHRTTLDKENHVTSKRMLEIIIIIKKENMFFDDLELSKTVSKLFDDYKSKKIKFRSFSFIQLKYGTNLTQDMKTKVDQIVFDSSRGQHITVINCFYNSSEKTLYFLHNKASYPTQYYKYTVDLINKLVK